jgi:hypothetical protein
MTGHRHFGLRSSGRDATGHPDHSPGADTRADNVLPFLQASRQTGHRPTESFGSPSYSRPRHWLTQLALDVLAVAAAISFLIVTAACIVWAPVMLLLGSF